MPKRLEDMTEPEIRNLMNGICRAIEKAAIEGGLDTKPRFALVVFNDPKVGQYAANCTRESMIEALTETVERLSNRKDIPR